MDKQNYFLPMVIYIITSGSLISFENVPVVAFSGEILVVLFPLSNPIELEALSIVKGTNACSSHSLQESWNVCRLFYWWLMYLYK